MTELPLSPFKRLADTTIEDNDYLSYFRSEAIEEIRKETENLGDAIARKSVQIAFNSGRFTVKKKDIKLATKIIVGGK